jgi:hypothetical protein
VLLEARAELAVVIDEDLGVGRELQAEARADERGVAAEGDAGRGEGASRDADERGGEALRGVEEFVAPTELLITASPVTLPLTPTLPGVIVPALVTTPVTVDPVITIDVVEWPAGLVTLATVWPMIACPAGAGVARRSAATEVVARSAGATPLLSTRLGFEEKIGTRSPFIRRERHARRF